MTFLPVTALLEEMAFTSGMIFLEGMPRLDNNTTVGKNAIISKNTSLKLKNNYDAIVQLQDKTRHDRNRITKPPPPPPPSDPPYTTIKIKVQEGLVASFGFSRNGAALL
jgi:hypothetical protein